MSSFAQLVQPPAVVWQWHDEKKGWIDYDDETSSMLEAVYQRGTSSMPLLHGTFAQRGGYTVDFTNMTQRRHTTGFSRPVRRANTAPQAQVPSAFSTSAPINTPAPGSPAPVAPSASPVWEWRGDNAWHIYDDQTCMVLEHVYQAGLSNGWPQSGPLPVITLDHGFFGKQGNYEIDLNRCEQKKLATGYLRNVRRRPAMASLSLSQGQHQSMANPNSQSINNLNSSQQSNPPGMPTMNSPPQSLYGSAISVPSSVVNPNSSFSQLNQTHASAMNSSIPFQSSPILVPLAGTALNLQPQSPQTFGGSPPSQYSTSSPSPKLPPNLSILTANPNSSFSTSSPANPFSPQSLQSLHSTTSSPVVKTLQISNDDKKRNFLDVTQAAFYTGTDGDCAICLEQYAQTLDQEAYTLPCNHTYHYDCLIGCFKKGSLDCPTCRKTFGVRLGSQPEGRMRVNVMPIGQLPLQGFQCGTIVIELSFHGGIQGPEHPNPGQPYNGTQRTAYLPDNDIGREVLELLQIAWERKLLFTIGRSVTTGKDNQVVWNGIHLKTRPDGGAANHGYPDDEYFDRVKEELKSFGVEKK